MHVRELVMLVVFLSGLACTDERGRVTPDTYPTIAPQDREPTEPTGMYIDFRATNAAVASTTVPNPAKNLPGPSSS